VSAVLALKKKAFGSPFFAVPAVSKGDFFLSQTPAICRCNAPPPPPLTPPPPDLGKLFHLWPPTAEEEAHADMILCGVCDLVSEGHDAVGTPPPLPPDSAQWHPTRHESYESQREAAEPHVQHYKQQRLPRWLDFFEAVLQFNDGGDGFFVGERLTYVDLCVFHVLDGIEFQCPAEWDV
jgi:glutathione S-transferase